MSQYTNFVFQFSKKDAEVQTEERENGSLQMRAKFFLSADVNRRLMGWSNLKKSKCHQTRDSEKFGEPTDPTRQWTRIVPKTDAVPLKIHYVSRPLAEIPRPPSPVRRDLFQQPIREEVVPEGAPAWQLIPLEDKFRKIFKIDKNKITHHTRIVVSSIKEVKKTVVNEEAINRRNKRKILEDQFFKAPVKKINVERRLRDQKKIIKNLNKIEKIEKNVNNNDNNNSSFVNNNVNFVNNDSNFENDILDINCEIEFLE